MKRISVLVPDLPESVTDATVIKWHKKVGDKVYSDNNIVDIETDKVMLEVSSPCNGILKSIIKQEGDKVQSQELIGEIDQVNTITNNIFNAFNQNKKKDSSEIKEYIKSKRDLKLYLQENNKHLSPSMRRLLKINEINHDDIDNNTKIENTIDQNEISEKEEKFANRLLSNNFLNKQQDNIKEENKFQSRVKMTRIRQRIAERLLYSKNNTAMLTTFNEVNMEPIILLRKKYGEDFKKEHGIRMGFMSFFVKSVVQALKKFPQINASIDKTDIIFYKNFDINIAISTPRGLITPVLRNAENMTMSEIEKKIKDFSVRGFNNKINITELTGGNFTITNGGVFGSLMSTPIINPPQIAILGMHVIQDRPIVINGKIKILPMMYLALSYDHCLIDGKESVSFLITIKNILEDFTRILIDI